MNYIKKLSDKPDFSQKGLNGYNYDLGFDGKDNDLY